MQRIYGFIGALPNIMASVVEQYGMTKVVLSKIIVFVVIQKCSSLIKMFEQMLLLVFAPCIQSDEIAKLPGFWGISQQDEGQQITSKVQALIGDGAEKIALLFRGRGKNAEIVESELSKANIPYFYGMFTDEDTEYINFHNACQEEFIRRFGSQKAISKKSINLFFKWHEDCIFFKTRKKTIDSLLKLLDALVEKVSIDYADLLPADKYALLLDIFENRQLKQAMEYVDSAVILSTVHGAKGLEWDYVILGDMERWLFRGYHICNGCTKTSLCQLLIAGVPCQVYCHLPLEMSY